ncbi:unnamed protein product [Penicillium crustosum]
MGNKISAVHGVKSDHFYDQGNAVNEIWVGDVEVISRLPFGDSDLEQAGWPKGDFPKIPWHHFIIPMQKRDEASNTTANPSSSVMNGTTCTCTDWLPDHGYLGMYTRIHPDAACLVGAIFLLVAGYRVAIRRTANCDLCIRLGQAYVVFVLSILCLVLGLPAIAAGAKKLDAASFVLYNGFWGGIGAIISGLVVYPLIMWWEPRKLQPAKSDEP